MDEHLLNSSDLSQKLPYLLLQLTYAIRLNKHLPLFIDTGRIHSLFFAAHYRQTLVT